jgi:hypothetical protein
MYDPCLQWFFPIGKNQTVLGMQTTVDETTREQVVKGWTSPAHPEFNGHPNYFIAPLMYLVWWMSKMRECLLSFHDMISGQQFLFQMDGETHELELARFELDGMFDREFEDHGCLTTTAAHTIDYVKKVLFHLNLFYATHKTHLLDQFGDKFLQELRKCDFCLRSIQDFRERAEIHQFFGFFRGLGVNSDFFFKLFLAWRWETDLEGFSFRTDQFTIRDPSDVGNFFTWLSFSFYAKVTTSIRLVCLHNI